MVKLLNKLNTTKISPSNINDLATREDLLGFKPYVKAIVDFLTNKNTNPPVTMSIEGEWGSGKSSFILQLEDKIEDKNGKIVHFNAWRHDKAEALWATFISDLISQLSEKTSNKGRLKGYFRLLRLRLNLKNSFSK